jgi:hypothetical protein
MKKKKKIQNKKGIPKLQGKMMVVRSFEMIPDPIKNWPMVSRENKE